MAFLVRLPKGLDESARGYAEAAGLSLNGLVSVALLEYLRARPDRPRPVDLPATTPTVADSSAAGAPVIHERHNPKAITRQQRRFVERIAKKGKR
jgi:hypothetical protein